MSVQTKGNVMIRPVGMALVAGAALSLTGCAGGIPAYESLAPAVPGAAIRLEKGYSGNSIFTGASQTYLFSGSDYCASRRVAALLGAITSDMRTLRVPAGEAVVVTASTTFTTGRGNLGTVTDVCQNVSRFTPELGRVYSVKQNARYGGRRCSLAIVDTETGRPPADLERLNPAVVCP